MQQTMAIFFVAVLLSIAARRQTARVSTRGARERAEGLCVRLAILGGVLRELQSKGSHVGRGKRKRRARYTPQALLTPLTSSSQVEF
jgi:hypothetical protein